MALPIRISTDAALSALCHCDGDDCVCLVMHYPFIDEHNQLMRAWFMIQKAALTQLLAASTSSVMDLSGEAETLAVMPDGCSDELLEVLQLNMASTPTMH